MKLEGEYVFDAGIQEVWDALFDPAVLAAVLPGCEKLDKVDGSYVGEIKVKVGPIQGKFSGKVDLLDLVEPSSYRMVVDGRGAQGFVKATASIKLEAEGSSTRVRYDSDAQVGGKIASVGARLVETSAKAVVKQSLEGLAENIQIRTAAHRAQASAAPPVAESKPEPEPEPEPEPGAEPASTPEPVAVAAPEPEPPQAPAIEYKRADPKKLAGAVAKDVTRSLAPFIAIAVVALAVIIYLVVR